MMGTVLRGIRCLGLALASGAALAQTPPDTALPKALKDIRPAAGMCVREDAAPPQAEVKANVVKPDLSCAITPADLSRRITAPDTVLADVRTAAEYAAFHIENALNATASELAFKRFLHGKTVVLVGDGKAEQELYAACARLKSQGIKQARVLRGGLPAWLSSGQAVLGRAPDAAQLARLTPVELLAESRFNANLILVPRNRDDIRRWLPSSVLIAQESPAAIQEAVNARRKKLNNAPLASVVLVAADADNETIRRLIQAIGPIPLLAYSDTTDAFARQIAQQEAIGLAQAHGPKKPGCGR